MLHIFFPYEGAICLAIEMHHQRCDSAVFGASGNCTHPQNRCRAATAGTRIVLEAVAASAVLSISFPQYAATSASTSVLTAVVKAVKASSSLIRLLVHDPVQRENTENTKTMELMGRLEEWRLLSVLGPWLKPIASAMKRMAHRSSCSSTRMSEVAAEALAAQVFDIETMGTMGSSDGAVRALTATAKLAYSLTAHDHECTTRAGRAGAPKQPKGMLVTGGVSTLLAVVSAQLLQPFATHCPPETRETREKHAEPAELASVAQSTSVESTATPEMGANSNPNEGARSAPKLDGNIGSASCVHDYECGDNSQSSTVEGITLCRSNEVYLAESMSVTARKRAQRFWTSMAESEGGGAQRDQAPVIFDCQALLS